MAEGQTVGGARKRVHVATVIPSGKTITHDGQRFVFDGGPLPAEKLMEYDHIGILVWVSEDMQEWVSRAADHEVSGVSATSAAERETPGSHAPIARALGRLVGALRARPRLVWTIVAYALAFASFAQILPGSPQGAWVARLANGAPGFILRIDADSYSIEFGDGSTMERGSAEIGGGRLTLTPEWTFTELVDFWGAGHGEPFRCSFEVRGDRLSVSGGSGVIREWERYE